MSWERRFNRFWNWLNGSPPDVSIRNAIFKDTDPSQEAELKE